MVGEREKCGDLARTADRRGDGGGGGERRPGVARDFPAKRISGDGERGLRFVVALAARVAVVSRYIGDNVGAVAVGGAGDGVDAGALPLTAAAKWVLKDGVGSVATLLAGSFGGQKYDEDPKRWWGLTNALEDVARAIELVTPAAPGLFLPLAASAVFVRSAALTGRGSLLNGTFMQHFGRNNNLGDIRAKLEVQGRWLALIALPTGIQVFQLVSAAAADFVDDGDELSAFVAAFAIYGVVIGVHVFACWQAAKSLRFDSLNRFRLLTLAEMFVANEDEELPDCVVVGDIEGVYKPRRTAQTPTFGASPSEIGQSWEDFTQAVFMAKGRPYVLGCDPKRADIASVLLFDAATPRDVIAAALACQKLRVDGSRSRAYEYADAKVADFEAGLHARDGRWISFNLAPRPPSPSRRASARETTTIRRRRRADANIAIRHH